MGKIFIPCPLQFMLSKFILPLYVLSIVWQDITKYTEYVSKYIRDCEYEFLNVQLINGSWIEFDCKSDEIVDGIFYIHQSKYEDGCVSATFIVLQGKKQLNCFCSGRENGLFNYLCSFQCFDEYVHGEENERDNLLKECLDNLKEANCPELIYTNLHRLVLENLAEPESLKSFFEQEFSDHKVCAFLDLDDFEGDFECQKRYFLKRKDGKFLITNILKFKLENDRYFIRGEGDKIESDFDEFDTTNEKLKKSRKVIRTDIIVLAVLLGFACVCICALVYYIFSNKLNG